MQTRLGALMLLFSVSVASAQSPWVVTPRTPLNPDQAGVYSTDPAAGASLVNIVPPIPAPGSWLTLRVASHLTGQIDLTHIVVPGDTTQSIAADLCNQINGNTTLASGPVTCQLSPGDSFFGVTHYSNNEMAATSMTAPTIVQVSNGSMAWDAGPILFLDRAPPGVTPLPGSNCGQIFAAAPNSATPGVASTQYFMINCTVANPDANHLDGELAIYTAQTINGAWLLGKRLAVSGFGI